MKSTFKAGIALAALTSAVTMSGSVFAADLGAAPRGGSVKDGYVQAMPEIVRGSSGPCYFRADVGYSLSNDPSASWPVANNVGTDFNGNGVFDYGEIVSTFLGSKVSNTSLDNSWFGEVGAGCGIGAGMGAGRGFRAELMLGVHGDRDFVGEPLTYDPGPKIGDLVPGFVPTPNTDPMHTSIQSYTLMMNVYKDLGTYGRMTPYVGAGIGAAYNQLDDVSFTGNYFLPNHIHGENELSFAWSLMAGVGYQVSDRAVLDFGYRYIDLGSAHSGNGDSAGQYNPRVNIDDLTAHEFKIGLRYAFGGGDCCAQEYAPMK